METIATGAGKGPERHVAAFAFPFSSHPPILLNLVHRLASAAPSLTFSFFSTAVSNRALFSSPISGNVRHYDVSDGVPEEHVFTGGPEERISLFLGVAKEELRRGVEVAEAEVGRRIGCVVTDAFLWFSGEMAEEMRVPWVAFWTSGACSLSAHVHTDLIREKFGYAGTIASEDEIVDSIPGFSAVRLGDLPKGVLFGNLESPFSIMVHKMGRSLTNATAVPINSFEELDPDLTKDLTSKLKNFLNIGHFNLISKPKPSSEFDKFSCISWLDTQKPQSIAYISFGTVVRPPPHELAALAEALEETKTPFLFSINDDSKKHFPEGFLERTSSNGMGKVVPWAPQVQVLEHFAIGVFVTHGGWNSVMESVAAGVPMICRPFFGDHNIDSWMVENIWGIGVRTEGGVFTKLGVCHALKQILASTESSKRFRERITTLKRLAHKGVEPTGSSSRNFKTLLNVIIGATL